jgi:myosin heavy subunit
MNLYRALCCFYLFLMPLAGICQTAGSGTLATIESLANSIQKNDERVAALNRQHLASYEAENEKLAEHKKRLRELIAEKNRALQELKSGLYCSECKRPKSEIERNGSETFAGHLRRVRGVSVPATRQHIESKMAEYDRLIKTQEDLIKKFETEENEFTRKRADLSKQMDDLKAKSDELRDKIVELSKQYKDKINQEAKSMTLLWVDDILHTLAEKHHAEDRIDIIKVKQGELQQEEARATAELKDKVAQQAATQKKQLQEKIATNKVKITELEQLYKDRAARLNTELNNLRTKLSSVKTELQLNTKLSSDEKATLDANQKELENRISQLLKELEQYENRFESDRQILQKDNRESEEKIWDLTVNLTKAQDQALQNLKQAFSTKKKILQDAQEARLAALERLGKLIGDKKNVYKKKQLEHNARLESERIRLIEACEKAGCACYGKDAQGDFNLIANNRYACIGSMENVHANNSSFYGCEEESVKYRSKYQSWVNGFSDADIEALRKTSSKTRYDLILKKVTN